jgi:hypothetical protein
LEPSPSRQNRLALSPPLQKNFSSPVSSNNASRSSRR